MNVPPAVSRPNGKKYSRDEQPHPRGGDVISMRVEDFSCEGIHAEFEGGPGVVGEAEGVGLGAVEAGGFDVGEEVEEVVELEGGALDVDGDFAGLDEASRVLAEHGCWCLLLDGGGGHHSLVRSIC